MMWRYAWVVGGGAVQKSRLHEPEAAREVFAAHRLKCAKEQGFHQLLGGSPPKKWRGGAHLV
ncbi:MAG: hypothetical protein Fur0032_24790 [Terrimicrobiaceae bacterium]